MDRFEFINYMGADNCYAVTLKYKPMFHGDPNMIRIASEELEKYCNKRGIIFDFHSENEDTNYHLHGIMVFSGFDKQVKAFRKWFNRYYGTFHVSEKGADLNGWYNYCTKDRFKD